MTHVFMSSKARENRTLRQPCDCHRQSVHPSIGSWTARCTKCRAEFRVVCTPAPVHWGADIYRIEIAPVESSPTVPGRKAGAPSTPVPSPTTEQVA